MEQNHKKRRNYRRSRRYRNYKRWARLLGVLVLLALSCTLIVYKYKGRDKDDNEAADAEQGEEVQAEETSASGGYVPAEVTMAASDDLEILAADLESMIAEEGGTWSIYVKDLDTGETISINSQDMYAASLIKLFVMEDSFREMDMLIENDMQYSFDAEESEAWIMDTMANMIEISDNESYNELVRLHSSNYSFTEGCVPINAYLAECGYADTQIYHTLHPSSSTMESTDWSAGNTTSVEDCGRLLEKIYEGTCVSESASEQMLELLLQQANREKIPAGIPDGVLVANKTGETEEDQHDAAIVFGPKRTYILCVMSGGLPEIGTAMTKIRNISAVVYEYLNE